MWNTTNNPKLNSFDIRKFQTREYHSFNNSPVFYPALSPASSFETLQFYCNRCKIYFQSLDSGQSCCIRLNFCKLYFQVHFSLDFITVKAINRPSVEFILLSGCSISQLLGSLISVNVWMNKQKNSSIHSTLYYVNLQEV
jgi:hypothetical protein